MLQAPKKLPNTYFVIGESRTNSDNAITKIYGSFYVAMWPLRWMEKAKRYWLFNVPIRWD